MRVILISMLTLILINPGPHDPFIDLYLFTPVRDIDRWPRKNLDCQVDDGHGRHVAF